MEASIYIETAGCAFNVADGEVMAGVLSRAGYRLERDPRAADLVILNTCTVKDRTFLNFRRRLGQLGRTPDSPAGPPLVVAGCIPPAYARTSLLDDVSTLDPDSIDRVGDVVRDTLRGRVVHARASAPLRSRPGLPTIRRNPIVEILPIARGCRSACAFCQTRISRGKLFSFSMPEILDRARQALDDGVKELWVTGQDTGTWGMDVDSSLPELLRELLQLRGDFRVRLGMTSPQWVTPKLAEYLDLFSHPKMFRFFHVPVQSGSDAVLRRMRREGSVREFESIHSAYIERFPDGTFLTDLIAGFPGESEADFEKTRALVERLGLPGANVSRFSPRPGTAAARMKAVDPASVKRRTRMLMDQVRRSAARYHAERVGTRCRVLMDQHREDGRGQGRTEAYRPVLFEEALALGSWVEAELTGASDFSFRGAVVAPACAAPGQSAV